jgi:hypothetical protein
MEAVTKSLGRYQLSTTQSLLARYDGPPTYDFPVWTDGCCIPGLVPRIPRIEIVVMIASATKMRAPAFL